MQFGWVSAHIEHIGRGQTQFRAQAVENALARVFDVLVERLVHVNEIKEENRTLQQSLGSANAALQTWTAVRTAKIKYTINYFS